MFLVLATRVRSPQSSRRRTSRWLIEQTRQTEFTLDGESCEMKFRRRQRSPAATIGQISSLTFWSAGVPMDTQVLVVGAGPTGLMLANQLARRGVQTLIIDRHSGPSLETRAL